MSLIEDYKNPEFTTIFRAYFQEIGHPLDEDTILFDLMNKDKVENNMETLLLFEDGVLCAFVMFQINIIKGWFFEKKDGFIREFYVSPAYRKKGYGTILLQAAEKHLKEQGIYALVLTTYSAASYYEKQGYVRDGSYTAANEFDVYTKLI